MSLSVSTLSQDKGRRHTFVKWRVGRAGVTEIVLEVVAICPLLEGRPDDGVGGRVDDGDVGDSSVSVESEDVDGHFRPGLFIHERFVSLVRRRAEGRRKHLPSVDVVLVVVVLQPTAKSPVAVGGEHVAGQILLCDLRHLCEIVSESGDEVAGEKRKEGTQLVFALGMPFRSSLNRDPQTSEDLSPGCSKLRESVKK